jgi:hypothetical protein
MISSLLNRIILLALLPIIALIVYLEGQKYDPALIKFTASDISTGAEAALFPREIGGFSRTGQVRVFSRDNLYEYVNGHAEYFLSAGFQRLAVGEYVQTGTEPSQPDVIVDIYDMEKNIQAFGVLTDEIGDSPASDLFGATGAKTAQGVSFINKKYYVRIAVFRGDVPVDLFAKYINRSIGSSPESISSFSRFPVVGDVVATRFVKEAYRGLDFARNVMEREYRIRDKRIQVSLFEGTGVEVKRLISAYLQFFSESEVEHARMERDGQEFYKVIDPYEGDWYLVPLRDALIGIYGVADEEILGQFLSALRNSNRGKS